MKLNIEYDMVNLTVQLAAKELKTQIQKLKHLLMFGVV